MKFLSWISLRFLFFSSQSIFKGKSVTSLIGLVLGVACLVVSMAVVSGFEKTLKYSVGEVSGHLRVIKTQNDFKTSEELLAEIKKNSPEVISGVSFLNAEGVLTKQGQLQGVLLHGVDVANLRSTLNLHGRVIEGHFDLQDSELPSVLIGHALAKKFSLKPGDKFKIVVPLTSELDPGSFRRQVGEFVVSGILNMGKYEYDQRLVFLPLRSLQKLISAEGKFTGMFLKLDNIDKARTVGNHLLNKINGVRVWDWRDVNENLFAAIEVERVVIFFVILVIIIAAAFNVASSLYVSVVRRYSDIGILKAIGFSNAKIRLIFTLQGLYLGVVGLLLGIGLGLLLGLIFFWAQQRLGLIPADVYKISEIKLNIRMIDLIWIAVATLVICVGATLAPSKQGSQLNPVEGLRHG